ncbi:uncharacterized protein LOC124367289 [Homalodisca vitripennis]|uniref:uncharacterized protein LOC124367289 n=1 Tax=Homalodisca vitripennis TaxID=197043 RepID=UPI001EEBD717|nr:uncharacterized protein LOC124367289 [Homalodisca vitripennis]KAG8306205.1 Protein natd1 [Homalodisca vitripennis]
MSFLKKLVLSSQFRVLHSVTQAKDISKFSTYMSLKAKYGKLINDHVTNAFYLPIGEDGSDMGMVLYEQQKGILNLHHTEVPEHLRGKSVGHDLAKEVFEYCSARNLKVLLTCEFLQKFYEENPQYKDLVVKR